MKAINYPALEGCCHGFAMRWLEACILGQGAVFEQRIDKIFSAKEDFIFKINAIQKGNEQKKNEHHDVFDILAFFDSLILFQNASEYQAIFSERLTSYQVEPLSYFASSKSVFLLGGLAQIHSQSGIYTVSELKNYLGTLSDVIETYAPLQKEPYGILLSNLEHSVAMSYTQRKGWAFMDINQYPVKRCSQLQIENLAKLIQYAFNDDPNTPYVAFNTSFYTVGTRKSSLLKFSKKLKQFTQQAINQDVVQREAEGGVNLIYLAAAHAEVDLLSDLALHGANLNQKFKGNLPLTNYVVRLGHTELVEKLSECQVDLTQVTPTSGNHFVHEAAQYGYEEVIDTAEKLGVDLSLENKRGQTPLHLAVLKGHLGIVSRLVENHVDLNKKDAFGLTPLHYAVKSGQLDVTIALIQVGADLNLCSPSGLTPVSMAAFNGHEKVVAELAKHGADLERGLQLTPVFWATLHGYLPVIETLKGFGAVLDKSYLLSAEYLNSLVKNKDESTKQRMDSFIKKYRDNSLYISITLKQLAGVMGHKDIEGFFKNHVGLKRRLSGHFFDTSPPAKKTKIDTSEVIFATIQLPNSGLK